MDRQPDFSKNASIESSHIALFKFKFREIEKDAIVLLSYQVNEAFCYTKGLYGMRN